MAGQKENQKTKLGTLETKLGPEHTDGYEGDCDTGQRKTLT